MCSLCGLTPIDVRQGRTVQCGCKQCEQLFIRNGTLAGFGIGESWWCAFCNHYVGGADSIYPEHEVRDFEKYGNTPHTPDYAICITERKKKGWIKRLFTRRGSNEDICCCEMEE